MAQEIRNRKYLFVDDMSLTQKPCGQIGGFYGPKTLRIGEFQCPKINHIGQFYDPNFVWPDRSILGPKALHSGWNQFYVKLEQYEHTIRGF